MKQLGHIDKLTDQSRVEVFIGYVEGAKAYCILDPVARKVCTTCDVVFDEPYDWDWIVTTGAPPVAEFTIEYIYVRASGAVAMVRPTSPCARAHRLQVSGLWLCHPRRQSPHRVHS
jgi:hypothetical protein